jgi:hypothetical protein
MDITIFEEVIAKAKCDYNVFNNFFYQGKDEYVIHNSLKLDKNSYLISGLGVYNSLCDFKIKLDEIRRTDEYILYSIPQSAENIIEFYKIKHVGETKTLSQLLMAYVIVVQSVYNFYEEYVNYFDKIVKLK